MKPLEIRAATDNPIIFVSDPAGEKEIPLESIGTGPIVASPSCIAITTLPAMLGETTVRLGDALENPEGELAFATTLETPGRTVAVTSATLETFLSMHVKNQMTNVKIWVNAQEQPDLIIIQAQ